VVSIYKRRIVCLTAWRGLDGRTQTGCGRRRGRGGTVRGLGAYLQHGLGVMPGEIAAETGRLSASVPTPRRSSSRLGSGLLITTVVVQAYKEAGQTGRNACLRPKSSQNRAKRDFGSLILNWNSKYCCTNWRCYLQINGLIIRVTLDVGRRWWSQNCTHNMVHGGKWLGAESQVKHF